MASSLRSRAVETAAPTLRDEKEAAAARTRAEKAEDLARVAKKEALVNEYLTSIFGEYGEPFKVIGDLGRPNTSNGIYLSNQGNGVLITDGELYFIVFNLDDSAQNAGYRPYAEFAVLADSKLLSSDNLLSRTRVIKGYKSVGRVSDLVDLGRYIDRYRV